MIYNKHMLIPATRPNLLFEVRVKVNEKCQKKLTDSIDSMDLYLFGLIT